MENRGQDIYKKWAPFGVYWSQYAKPVLFTHMPEALGSPNALQIPWLSDELNGFLDTNTAVLIDLPGEESVLQGLAMAKRQGYRPIPLFNGVPEAQIGERKSIVDNSGMIKRLAQGADSLDQMNLALSAPPAFLLDSNRNMAVPHSDDLHDNRWSLMLEDMPRAEYMRTYQINKLVIWTDTEVKEDLLPIISAYEGSGIEVLIYRGQSLSRHGEYRDVISEPNGQTVISDDMWKNVRNFKNARYCLWIFAVFSFLQLFVMFTPIDEPLIWTSPGLLWIVYTVFQDAIANPIAVAIPVIYLVFYLLSKQKREFLTFGAIFFAVDTLALFAFAVSYGLYAFDIIELGIPVVILGFLIPGAIAWSKLRGVSDAAFQQAKKLVKEDREKNYRGFGGYAGRGRGGYRGGWGGGGFGG
ncbi:MAG: hypothetical protein FWD99_07360 [Oscillospiraceae bacterium]|nr:hypothetical protein [Oscillospiraceae bacterium]